MRVAITMDQSWAAVPGGIATSTNELARALVALDDVEVVGVAAAHRRPPAAGWTPEVPVRHLPLPRIPLWESWHRLRRPRVELATGPVDVVHGTILAIPAARAPLVVTIHDLAFRRYPEHFTSRGVAFFRRALELARRHARLVTCPSQATVRACVEMGFEPERLRHVPWGVRAEAATDEEVEELRDRRGLPERYALFCGTIEPRKNLPRLLRAFGQVRCDELTLVIAGPQGWNEDIADDLRALGSRARWLGPVARGELGALYAGAELAVYPSLSEGFGLPVLEAMAQGTPVVTSAGTAMEEVAHEAAILVDPLDVGSIAEAIDRLASDRAEASRLGAAGRRRASEYTWGRTAGAMVAVYREALGRA
jgi:glycosyltransferase involved in cell wall biosynthesis